MIVVLWCSTTQTAEIIWIQIRIARLHDCKCRKHSTEFFDVLRAASGVPAAAKEGVNWPFVVDDGKC